MGYGSIYHLFSRTLYGRIEKGNLRNRRAHSFEFIRTRLVLLDFILANRAEGNRGIPLRCEKAA